MSDETNNHGAHVAPEATTNVEESAAAHVVLQSAFCDSLRSKKFFMLDGLATEAEHYLDASNHCWCRETYLVVGPDGGRVRPERCVPGRSCYSSALGGE